MNIFLKIIRKVAWILAILLTVAALVANVAEWVSVISFGRFVSDGPNKADTVSHDETVTDTDAGEAAEDEGGKSGAGARIVGVIFSSLFTMVWMVIASGASLLGTLLSLVNVRDGDRDVRLSSRVMLGICGVVLFSQIVIVILIRFVL